MVHTADTFTVHFLISLVLDKQLTTSSASPCLSSNVLTNFFLSSTGSYNVRNERVMFRVTDEVFTPSGQPCVFTSMTSEGFIRYQLQLIVQRLEDFVQLFKFFRRHSVTPVAKLSIDKKKNLIYHTVTQIA